MTVQSREARLKPEHAALYRGVPPNQWKPVRELLDIVAASRLLGGRCSGEFLSGRALDQRHFEFRGGSTSPARRDLPHSRAVDTR
jgi:hypothetical protein